MSDEMTETALPGREVIVQRTRNGWVQVVADGGVACSYRGGHNAVVNAERTAEQLRNAAAVLDIYIPQRGQCGVCGVPGIDQTHRVIDAIAGMARAHIRDGENDVGWVAEEFGYEGGAALVLACLAWTSVTDAESWHAHAEAQTG